MTYQRILRDTSFRIRILLNFPALLFSPVLQPVRSSHLSQPKFTAHPIPQRRKHLGGCNDTNLPRVAGPGLKKMTSTPRHPGKYIPPEVFLIGIYFGGYPVIDSQFRWPWMSGVVGQMWPQKVVESSIFHTWGDMVAISLRHSQGNRLNLRSKKKQLL